MLLHPQGAAAAVSAMSGGSRAGSRATDSNWRWQNFLYTALYLCVTAQTKSRVIHQRPPEITRDTTIMYAHGRVAPRHSRCTEAIRMRTERGTRRLAVAGAEPSLGVHPARECGAHSRRLEDQLRCSQCGAPAGLSSSRAPREGCWQNKWTKPRASRAGISTSAPVLLHMHKSHGRTSSVPNRAFFSLKMPRTFAQGQQTWIIASSIK